VYWLLVALTDEGYKRPGIGQLRGAHKLPPLGPNLTPFRPANSGFRHLNIAGFPGRISVPHKRKKFKIFLKNE
jgi:hypothetical protein